MIALALAGYLLFVRTPHTDRNLLADLVIRRTPVHGLRARPASARSVIPSTSAVKTVKEAYKADPAHTGIYEIEWSSATSAPFDAGILLELLPNSKSAKAALAVSEKQLGSAPQLQGQTLSARKAFSIASVPGAVAASYSMKSQSTGKPSGNAYTVVFRVDRAVVTELLETSNTVQSDAGASSMARQERSLLQKVEPTFSMVRVPTPLISTLIFVFVALLIAAGAYFVPEWAIDTKARRRERHQARERERARSEFRARGRRAVRRHRAPAWRQPRRR